MSSSSKNLFGFHAVGVRVKTAPKSVYEVFYDVQHRDARMRQFTDRARHSGIKLVGSNGLRLPKMCGTSTISVRFFNSNFAGKQSLRPITAATQNAHDCCFKAAA